MKTKGMSCKLAELSQRVGGCIPENDAVKYTTTKMLKPKASAIFRRVEVSDKKQDPVDTAQNHQYNQWSSLRHFGKYCQGSGVKFIYFWPRIG